jgi:adenylate cyclase, class 2
MHHLLIEIKARCPAPLSIEAILRSQNARFVGLDHQIDTYFRVPNGRLKLREGNIENSLIHYNRDNESGPKQSDVTLLKSPNEVATLKKILTDSVGILAVVDKKRQIYFIENVKFHIDKVVGLGSFVEIEAIDSENTEGVLSREVLEKQCRFYINLFNIQESDLLTNSYSDMVMGLEETLHHDTDFDFDL